jgi:hypothetical protein
MTTLDWLPSLLWLLGGVPGAIKFVRHNPQHQHHGTNRRVLLALAALIGIAMGPISVFSQLTLEVTFRDEQP